MQTGDGEFNQILQIDAGTAFKVKNTSLYANAYVGFNNRTNGFSDEVRYGIEAGGSFLNNKIESKGLVPGTNGISGGTGNRCNNVSFLAEKGIDQ